MLSEEMPACLASICSCAPGWLTTQVRSFLWRAGTRCQCYSYHLFNMTMDHGPVPDNTGYPASAVTILKLRNRLYCARREKALKKNNPWVYHFLFKSPIRTDRRKGCGRVWAKILGVMRVNVLILARDTGRKPKTDCWLRKSQIKRLQS